MLKVFKGCVVVNFDLDILFVKLTAQIGYCFREIHSGNCVSGVADFMQCLFLILILVRCLYYGALLDLFSCKSDSCRRCTCTNVFLECEGELGVLVQPGGVWGLPWGLLCRASGRKGLCTVPCHSFYIYGIWTSRRKKVSGMLKVGGGNASHKRGLFW